MLVVVALLLLSGIIVLIPKDVEAVGQPNITVSMIMSYNGYDPDDPVDISTGFVGYDPFQEPTGEEIVEIEGTVEISSDLPNVVQKITVELDSYISNEYHGDIVVDYTCYPEKMIFTNLRPGQTLSSNYTMSVVIDSSVPAGENIVHIGGRWYHDPVPTGGEIPYGGGPLHIAPVVSAGFDDYDSRIIMLPNDDDRVKAELIINGNVKDPYLIFQIDGMDEAVDGGFSITPELVSDTALHIILSSKNVEPLTNWDFKVHMLDEINDRELDSFEFTIEITDEPPTDDDDDDPPIGDDDDEEPLELLTEAQCRRTYTDAVGDDLHFWAETDDAGVQLGDHPGVDITNMVVERDEDDLVITITTSGIIDEYTLFEIYFLPVNDHEQPPVDTDPSSSDDFPDYSPPNYIASTESYLLWVDWYVEEEIYGNTCTITGSLWDLMNEGLTEDFEVFIEVSLADWDLDLFGPGGFAVFKTVDYAGSGAWEVEDVKESSRDTSYDFSFLIVPVIVIVVVILLLILGVIFFIITRRRKSIFD